MELDDLDAALKTLKIGKGAVTFFQEEIDRFQKFVSEAVGTDISASAALCIGAVNDLDDAHWESAVKTFFGP